MSCNIGALQHDVSIDKDVKNWAGKIAIPQIVKVKSHKKWMENENVYA
jgi:hypothetical protein